MSLLLLRHVPYALCLPIAIGLTQFGQRSITLLDFLSTMEVTRAEETLAVSRPLLLLPTHTSTPSLPPYSKLSCTLHRPTLSTIVVHSPCVIQRQLKELSLAPRVGPRLPPREAYTSRMFLKFTLT